MVKGSCTLTSNILEIYYNTRNSDQIQRAGGDGHQLAERRGRIPATPHPIPGRGRRRRPSQHRLQLERGA